MISFEDIKKANETISTTNIKGKEYAEVNQRIKAFRMVYPEGAIETELQSNTEGICIFKAWVYGSKVWNEETGWTSTLLGTGTAYEKENSSFINKTSYIENCETSAVGRALGMAGFGIDTSIASAEEVQNAIEQQNQAITINKTMEQALREVIKNNNISTQRVLETLDDFGYEKLSEIKIKDLKNIQDKLEGG